ncbi:BON domain-containing protein [Cupriavidus gilardii]|uniref:BON domain-containing protein n=1 Tax=Cupriavidus gilardii TaxID=82541 RepID=UPI00157170B2|nr:BON domain-containing protein [Cupriavidus gilardii]NSX02661.1 BON domain-containing protein [Cupriavidus gilardii]
MANSNPSQPAPPTGTDTAAQDDDLLRQARDHIADEFGGAVPDGIEVGIEDKRIRLRGRVADLATAERIAKAAAIGPGILGVYNDLQAADASEPGSPIAGTEAADAINTPDPGERGERGAPLPPAPGPIHHKV